MSNAPLTGNAGLFASAKGSERTSSIPGAVGGGTNLPAAFAPLQPRTAEESSVTAAAASALSSWRPSGSTGKNALDDLRAFRDSQTANPTTPGIGAIAGGTVDFKPNFGLGDISKKISEGTDALGAKFTSFDIGKKFSKVATGAKEFLFGKSPEQIQKDSPAVAAWKKQQLANAAAGTASAASLNAALGKSNADDTKHLVTLTDSEGYVLTFYVMPEVVEQRSVEYEAVAPPQFPGAFQKYKGTTSVQWTVNATLICRTTPEATRNLQDLNRLRGWTMPFFGKKTQLDERFKNKTGAPPPVLMFKGFRESVVGEVPVVITSLSWNWPKDVDWIPAFELSDSGGPRPDWGDVSIPFPTIIQIAIQLVESFSTDQFNNFDLSEYRIGHMLGAFGTGPAKPSRTTGEAPQREEAQVPPEARVGTERGRATAAGTIAATVRVGTEKGRATLTEAVQSTTANIQKRVPSLAPPIKSGGGGDFGGGGASGSF